MAYFHWNRWQGFNWNGWLISPEYAQPYALTAKALPSGVISYSCNALGAVISKLHSNAGIEGGNAQAGRRTLAVKLHRKGYDLIHIKTLLGHKSVETTKKLVDGDPVNLASIVAGAV